MKKILYFLMIGSLGTILGCKKIPDGNLSDIIRYEQQPMEIKQGRPVVTDAINPAGSTKPITIKLIKIYKSETGEDVTSLFLTKYQQRVWKKPYDPKTDTTQALIDAKQVDSMVYPITLNSVSGQLEANYNTVHLPLGLYKFDVDVNNVAGTKSFPGIAEFKIVPALAFEVPAVRSTSAIMVGDETKSKSIPSNASHIKVTQLSKQGNKITVRFLDKNGAVFNPKKGEITRRPQSGTAGGYLQTMQDYAVGTVLYDDRIEFTYGVVPFPLVSLGNGFNYYYRIPTKFVHFDDALGILDNTYTCNARFSFQTFESGNFQIDVIVPQVTRRVYN
ncbi:MULTISPECIES: hypothetical protein [Sphingobacterium]|uniref:hypothetical protein n=1 Tax=Sphingobacterium TaxID=28453 RepID=UPI00062814E0|nr:hypothetical protein [Sphingobacterium sp. Ag1]KKO91222.1 hypothetical protein AAW12_11970 [Sphingobacterium sp. Ag1]